MNDLQALMNRYDTTGDLLDLLDRINCREGTRITEITYTHTQPPILTLRVIQGIAGPFTEERLIFPISDPRWRLAIMRLRYEQDAIHGDW